MGKLSCRRCGAAVEADSQEAADALINHGRGLMIGRPCSGKESDLVWSGESTRTVEVQVPAEDSPKKKKKSKGR